MRILDGGTKADETGCAASSGYYACMFNRGMRFNPAFLSGDTEAVADLSRFEKGMTYLPGSYEVEVWVNDSLYSLVL